MSGPQIIDSDASFQLSFRPALDGLRALAIALVLLSHSIIIFRPWDANVLGGAIIGVDIFFALSGFLITTLLLEELRQRSQVSYARFYARRALRLLPALYAMLVLFAIYATIDRIAAWRTIAATYVEVALYISNYFRADHSFTTYWFGQMWSLSVEEQFYFVWPVLLVVLSRWAKDRRGRLLFPLFGATASFAWWRVALLASYHANRYETVYPRTDARFDEFLVGAILAVILHKAIIRDRPRPWLGPPAMAALTGVVVFASPLDVGYYEWGIPITVTATCLIILSVLHGEGLTARVLSLAPVRWLGRVSYALYLIHVFIFIALARHFAGTHTSSWVQICLANIAAILSAGFVHYVVERPALKIKRRFISTRSELTRPVD